MQCIEPISAVREVNSLVTATRTQHFFQTYITHLCKERYVLKERGMSYSLSAICMCLSSFLTRLYFFSLVVLVFCLLTIY